MRARLVISFWTALFSLVALGFFAPVHAQTSTGVSIKWVVKSRFRLFRSEGDFTYMEQHHGRNGVLADETALADINKGAGWAVSIVGRLCLNSDGKPVDSCSRTYSAPDAAGHVNADEAYLAPGSHRIGLTAQGAAATTLCTWQFVTDGGGGPPIIKDQPCNKDAITEVPYGKTTHVQLFVATNPENAQPTATADVAVRDIMIAGLGDSTAAGEGNPDRPIPLTSGGFCFRRFESLDDRSYFRPSRANYHGDYSCDDSSATEVDDARNWASIRATWMDRACHRSLYSYQLRVALALAIENPQLAVTYLPLGCTGATIPDGMLGRQEARESDCVLGVSPPGCSRFVTAQIVTLQQIMSAARQKNKSRNLDLVLLTVGANDIDFSGLVANVIIDHASKEFRVFSRFKRVSTVADAANKLTGLPAAFAGLRTSLKPFVNNKLDRVIYVSYGNPGLHNKGEPCPQGRQGFDVHPAFVVDGALLKSTADFVGTKFFPRLKSIATCGDGGGCQSPEQDRMTFVDDHQTPFEDHGFCATADSDPPFDRDCFLKTGDSFKTGQSNAAANDPMTCRQHLATGFQTYASRQRWVRTANDSYFAAMTYPDGVAKYMQPQNIHDPLWGAESAVYGGAMHPTAQGYAAMADAALPAARRLLSLPTPQ
jgi:lysophospholipase L1-like esterase